jgi:hypothetical protein
MEAATKALARHQWILFCGGFLVACLKFYKSPDEQGRSLMPEKCYRR